MFGINSKGDTAVYGKKGIIKWIGSNKKGEWIILKER